MTRSQREHAPSQAVPSPSDEDARDLFARCDSVTLAAGQGRGWSREQLQDVAHEIALDFLQKYGANLPTPGFVFHTARFKLRDAIRHEAVRRRRARDLAARHAARYEDECPVELADDVRVIFEGLTEDDRWILHQLFNLNQRGDEVASRLGLTESRVTARKWKALARLRTLCQDKEIAPRPALLAGLLEAIRRHWEAAGD